MKRRFSQQIISSLLVIWLSGIALLFCCGNLASAAEMPDSCPLAKSEHCNKSEKAKKTDNSYFTQKDEPAFDCCSFIPGLFKQKRNFERNQVSYSAEKTEKILVAKFSFVLPTVTNFSENYQTVFLQHKKNYLKNCTFRI